LNQTNWYPSRQSRIEAIGLEHVSRVYNIGEGNTVSELDDISLTIEKEEFV
jgi:ABC-type lipoprotein export system ATPase subunit